MQQGPWEGPNVEEAVDAGSHSDLRLVPHVIQESVTPRVRLQGLAVADALTWDGEEVDIIVLVLVWLVVSDGEGQAAIAHRLDKDLAAYHPSEDCVRHGYG
jgi:hypothetical protein